MKSSTCSFYLLSLTFFTLLTYSKNIDVDSWSDHRVVISNYTVEYKIPPSLHPGYGPQRTEIAFDGRSTDNEGFRFGETARQKSIATYHFNAAKNSSDFDLTVRVFAMKFSDANIPIASTNALMEYVRKTLSEKDKLLNGNEVNTLGSVTALKIDSCEAVVATAADLYHVSEVTLADRSVTALQPYQWYFVRLDDKLVVGLHLQHFTQKRLTPKWHADANAMAVSIIQNLKVSPAK